jgi:hypothetical protein
MTDPNIDPIKRMLDEQKRIADLVSGGPVKRMLDEQKRIADLVSGGPVKEMRDAQKRIAGLTSDEPMQRMWDEQKRISDLLSGGPVKEMLDAQKRMADLLSGGPVKQMLDAQKRIAERLSGTQFAAFQQVVADTVYEAAAGEAIAETDVAVEATPDETWDWIPTREQAQALTDVVTFVVALVWFSLALVRTDIPETTQRAIDALLAFAVVMARYAKP